MVVTDSVLTKPSCIVQNSGGSPLIKIRWAEQLFLRVHLLKAAPATPHKMIYKLSHLMFLMNLKVVLFILNLGLLILIVKETGGCHWQWSNFSYY